MKKNLVAFLAIVMAIAVSSFTVKKSIAVYLMYNGTGTQRSINSFPIVPPATTYRTTQPAHIDGAGKLNWFKVPDATSSTQVTQAQFEAAFDNLDSDADQLLSDELDVTGSLDVKN